MTLISKGCGGVTSEIACRRVIGPVRFEAEFTPTGGLVEKSERGAFRELRACDGGDKRGGFLRAENSVTLCLITLYEK